MSKTPSPQANKVPKNLSLDKEVVELFDTYCNANRQVVSVSRAVEDFMINTLKKKGRAYGLRLPSRLLPK